MFVNPIYLTSVRVTLYYSLCYPLFIISNMLNSLKNIAINERSRFLEYTVYTSITYINRSTLTRTPSVFVLISVY